MRPSCPSGSLICRSSSPRGAKAEGNEVRLGLLAPAFRAITREGGPEGGGPKGAPKSVAITQDGWKEVTLTIDDKQVVVLDAQGKMVDRKTLPGRIKGRTPVLLALDGRPEPFDLQTTKPDTLIVVVPMDRMLVAQGGPREGGLPSPGRPGPGKFLEVGGVYRFSYGAGDEDARVDVLEPPCGGWVKVRHQKTDTEGWINLAAVREIKPAPAAKKKE
jgi:hypothetical protein